MKKIGIETFGAGKNINIKDNIIDICQNIDLSNMNVINYVQIGKNTFYMEMEYEKYINWKFRYLWFIDDYQ